ncbi:MAG: hypothetical protein EXS37_09590 [Opitutus sp.]|nr:hypothetical protein [Opitutus sp.]
MISLASPVVGPAPFRLQIETVAAHGWTRNLELSNGAVKLLITLEVGPRILGYARLGGINVMRVNEDQIGRAGEPKWVSRGGHRLWLAPESVAFSYFPDNHPVRWERLGDWGVRLIPPPEPSTGFQKEMDVTLSPAGTRVQVVHRLIRTGATPAVAAPWALTVMRPGGWAILPQPPLGEHPRDLLPNRLMVVWPYSDLSDPRLRLGRNYIAVRQDPTRGPIKIGLRQDCGWSAYYVEGTLFVKEFAREPGAVYPDDGCNLEVFSNPRMLELESLGPLRECAPGEHMEHHEFWSLHDGLACDPMHEAEIDAMLAHLSSDFRSGPQR